MFDDVETWSGAAKTILLIVLLSSTTFACESKGPATQDAEISRQSPDVLNAGFVVAENVFNSELMAPFDIFHHTIFRDSDRYIRPFIVSPDGKKFKTFEGITIEADYSFDSSPPIDILVIPSTDGSMSDDLTNEAYMAFIESAAQGADWVLTLCDGAFPLAETGLLSGRVATTFPGDRDEFALRYPDVDLRYDANFVVDGKFVTSVGGALSYEPALYLVDRIYSWKAAAKTAEGMVLGWDPSSIPHIVDGEYALRSSD
ncbi:MAG: glutamine amidotransferase [Rhodothermales bacterium]|nr:glutamine amidotransferase [Rhodothermales bacterium]